MSARIGMARGVKDLPLRAGRYLLASTKGERRRRHGLRGGAGCQMRTVASAAVDPSTLCIGMRLVSRVRTLAPPAGLSA